MKVLLNSALKAHFAGIIFIMFLLCACKKPTTKVKAKAKPATTKDRLEYLTYGLPSAADVQNAEAIVAHRWGFTFKTVAGCEVTEKLTDSVAAHNQKIDQVLCKKHGKDWYTPFRKLVNAELVRDKKVIALLNTDARNVRKNVELKKDSSVLQYFIHPANDTMIYQASANALVMIKNQYKSVTYYQYLVNLKTHKVQLINDKLTMR